MHRAGAALSVVAAFLRSSEVNGLAQAIKQRRARVDAQLMILAVDAQRDGDRAFDVGSIRDWRPRAFLRSRAPDICRRSPGNERSYRASRRPKKRPPARI